MIHIEPERASLHGQFSAELPPVAVIDSGDRVRFRTLDVAWGMGQHPLEGSWRPKFEPRLAERDSGPALCGPLAVRGAEPGMTLEIELLRVVPASWGWTWVGRSELNAALMDALGAPEACLMRWDLDLATGIGRSETGQRVALAPFPGTIGMPEAGVGWQSGWLPWRTGGNMDCKLLVAGSTLFLPVAVPGGLLSVGDGHAAQGDGELGGSAIECPLDCLELRIRLREDMPIQAPQLRGAGFWATLGFGEDLPRAAAQAIEGMLDRVQRRHGLARSAALALIGVAADLRVSQMVNGRLGVHLVLPDAAIEPAPA